MELMSGPLTHKELITFILRQRVEELKGMETMAMKQGAKLKDTFFKSTFWLIVKPQTYENIMTDFTFLSVFEAKTLNFIVVL